MSDTDTFIDEVSEEVRRDKLFGYMRRYGWIAVVLVVLLVGGAAFNEWRKATERAAAEALGDAILAAEEQDDVAVRAEALAAIQATGEANAIVKLLAGNEGAVAVERLQALIDDSSVDALYRDLARLKLVSVPDSGLDLAAKRDLLAPLTVAGGPFRVLAEEQIALIEIEEGDKEAAITRLRALLEDNEATAPLRRRASQLIVALGGSLSAS